MYLSKILATKGTASFFSNQKLICVKKFVEGTIRGTIFICQRKKKLYSITLPELAEDVR